MSNMMPVNFMTKELKDDFTRLMAEETPKHLKPIYKSFLPNVFRTVEKFSLKLLSVLKEEARKGLHQIDLSSQQITEPGVNLKKLPFEKIVHNACKVLDLCGDFNFKSHNSHKEEKSRKLAYPYEIFLSSTAAKCNYCTTVYWAPRNPYLYPIIRLKEIEPINFAEIHYQNARDKIQTDFTLVDCEGNETYFHIFYLNGHSKYFETSLKDEFKDAGRLETQLSKQAMECLQQFVYLQKISHIEIHSIVVVCELLDFTRMTLMENLHKTMVNQMSILTGNYYLSPNDVLYLINEGFTSKKEEWIIHGLKVAEILEKNLDKQMVDWNLLSQQTLHQLLIESTKQNLECTKQKIIQTLDTLCKKTTGNISDTVE
ncbi:MAG: hypothetical protein H7A37_00850 [Chlamydiales bacterium]|nr:hypothetical protein [Chlamydiales bacterium]